MSPILVRPVREQLEHDRVIRILQVKLKRKHDVVANIGEDQTVPVRIGQVQIFPDLVLTSADRGKKLMGTVEVETAESVNHLEAMAQWAHLGRARAPFHLYVPAGCVDIARRLAAENGVNVAEIWSFHTIGDQTRFTLVHRAPVPEPRRAAQPRPCGANRRSAPRARGQETPRTRASETQGREPARDRQSRTRQTRDHAKGSAGARAKKEIASADAAHHTRQAWIREHLRRPYPAPADAHPSTDSLLVPVAARRARRPRGDRRGGHPADRSAPPADPLRLAADPQRRRGSHPAGAATATAAPSRTGRSPRRSGTTPPGRARGVRARRAARPGPRTPRVRGPGAAPGAARRRPCQHRPRGRRTSTAASSCTNRPRA